MTAEIVEYEETNADLMSQIMHTAFVQAIHAEPDDMTHRLVYADWLEEYGNEMDQARAEFIRLQIARQSQPAFHPQTRAALVREQQLLHRYADQWVGDLALYAPRWRFHRGFVEEVSLSCEQFLVHGSELFQRAPIRRLQLRHTSQLPRLLADARNARVFADHLVKIDTLDLNRDYLGEQAGSRLLNLPKLPRLRGLHLANHSLTWAGLRLLADSPVLSTLERLEINVNSSSHDCLTTLLMSANLRQLTHLSLAGTPGTNALIPWLLVAPVFSQLRSLSLGHGTLDAAGLRSMVHSPMVRNLEALELCFNSISAEGVRQLCESEQMEQLKWINLSRSWLEDDGAEILAQSDLLGQLHGIDLSLNRISDRGGRALADRTAEVQLLALDLIYNPLNPTTREMLQSRYGANVCVFVR
jgi:uncharacterized protein (TIGR02996 family)